MAEHMCEDLPGVDHEYKGLVCCLLLNQNLNVASAHTLMSLANTIMCVGPSKYSAVFWFWEAWHLRACVAKDVLSADGTNMNTTNKHHQSNPTVKGGVTIGVLFRWLGATWPWLTWSNHLGPCSKQKGHPKTSLLDL